MLRVMVRVRAVRGYLRGYLRGALRALLRALSGALSGALSRVTDRGPGGGSGGGPVVAPVGGMCSTSEFPIRFSGVWSEIVLLWSVCILCQLKHRSSMLRISYTCCCATLLQNQRQLRLCSDDGQSAERLVSFCEFGFLIKL